jgi:hypothetical protein
VSEIGKAINSRVFNDSTVKVYTGEIDQNKVPPSGTYADLSAALNIRCSGKFKGPFDPYAI